MMASVRIVTTNYYMSSPIRDLDSTYSEFRGNEVRQVPVIQIFGTSQTGQKTCLHIHGVYPYIYIPYDGIEPPDRLAYKIAAELDKSINITLGQASSNTCHISNIVLVSGIPLYGYHDKEHQFFKIFFYNPGILKKACSLLLNGAILGKSFDTYESHINYVLQFMIDYNLQGMNYIHVAQVRYRGDIEGSMPTGISPDLVLPNSVQRQSLSEVEIDALASDITNVNDVTSGKVTANPGIAALWEDERQRRRNKNMDSQISFCLSQDRTDVKSTGTHRFFKKKFWEKLLNTSQQSQNSEHLNNSVYPAETPDDAVILSATMAHNSLDTTVLDETIVDETPPDKANNDLELLDILCGLRESAQVEEDSILSQKVTEKESESSDDEQNLSLSLKAAANIDSDDEAWNNSFWDENCKIPQVDGNYSDSDVIVIDDDSRFDSHEKLDKYFDKNSKISQIDGNYSNDNVVLIEPENYDPMFNYHEEVLREENYWCPVDYEEYNSGSNSHGKWDKKGFGKKSKIPQVDADYNSSESSDGDRKVESPIFKRYTPISASNYVWTVSPPGEIESSSNDTWIVPNDEDENSKLSGFDDGDVSPEEFAFIQEASIDSNNQWWNVASVDENYNKTKLDNGYVWLDDQLKKLGSDNGNINLFDIDCEDINDMLVESIEPQHDEQIKLPEDNKQYYEWKDDGEQDNQSEDDCKSVSLRSVSDITSYQELLKDDDVNYKRLKFPVSAEPNGKIKNVFFEGTRRTRNQPTVVKVLSINNKKSRSILQNTNSNSYDRKIHVRDNLLIHGKNSPCRSRHRIPKHWKPDKAKRLHIISDFAFEPDQNSDNYLVTWEFDRYNSTKVKTSLKNNVLKGKDRLKSIDVSVAKASDDAASLYELKVKSYSRMSGFVIQDANAKANDENVSLYEHQARSYSGKSGPVIQDVLLTHNNTVCGERSERNFSNFDDSVFLEEEKQEDPYNLDMSLPDLCIGSISENSNHIEDTPLQSGWSVIKTEKSKKKTLPNGGVVKKRRKSLNNLIENIPKVISCLESQCLPEKKSLSNATLNSTNISITRFKNGQQSFENVSVKKHRWSLDGHADITLSDSADKKTPKSDTKEKYQKTSTEVKPNESSKTESKASPPITDSYFKCSPTENKAKPKKITLKTSSSKSDTMENKKTLTNVKPTETSKTPRIKETKSKAKKASPPDTSSTSEGSPSENKPKLKKKTLNPDKKKKILLKNVAPITDSSDENIHPSCHHNESSPEMTTEVRPKNKNKQLVIYFSEKNVNRLSLDGNADTTSSDSADKKTPKSDTKKKNKKTPTEVKPNKLSKTESKAKKASPPVTDSYFKCSPTENKAKPKEITLNSDKNKKITVRNFPPIMNSSDENIIPSSPKTTTEVGPKNKNRRLVISLSEKNINRWSLDGHADTTSPDSADKKTPKSDTKNKNKKSLTKVKSNESSKTESKAKKASPPITYSSSKGNPTENKAKPKQKTQKPDKNKRIRNIPPVMDLSDENISPSSQSYESSPETATEVGSKKENRRLVISSSLPPNSSWMINSSSEDIHRCSEAESTLEPDKVEETKRRSSRKKASAIKKSICNACQGTMCQSSRTSTKNVLIQKYRTEKKHKVSPISKEMVSSESSFETPPRTNVIETTPVLKHENRVVTTDYSEADEVKTSKVFSNMGFKEEIIKASDLVCSESEVPSNQINTVNFLDIPSDESTKDSSSDEDDPHSIKFKYEHKRRSSMEDVLLSLKSEEKNFQRTRKTVDKYVCQDFHTPSMKRSRKKKRPVTNTNNMVSDIGIETKPKSKKSITVILSPLHKRSSSSTSSKEITSTNNMINDNGSGTTPKSKYSVTGISKRKRGTPIPKKNLDGSICDKDVSKITLSSSSSLEGRRSKRGRSIYKKRVNFGEKPSDKEVASSSSEDGREVLCDRKVSNIALPSSSSLKGRRSKRAIPIYKKRLHFGEEPSDREVNTLASSSSKDNGISRRSSPKHVANKLAITVAEDPSDRKVANRIPSSSSKDSKINRRSSPKHVANELAVTVAEGSSNREIANNSDRKSNSSFKETKHSSRNSVSCDLRHTYKNLSDFKQRKQDYSKISINKGLQVSESRVLPTYPEKTLRVSLEYLDICKMNVTVDIGPKYNQPSKKSILDHSSNKKSDLNSSLKNQTEKRNTCVSSSTSEEILEPNEFRLRRTPIRKVTSRNFSTPKYSPLNVIRTTPTKIQHFDLADEDEEDQPLLKRLRSNTGQEWKVEEISGGVESSEPEPFTGNSGELPAIAILQKEVQEKKGRSIVVDEKLATCNTTNEFKETLTKSANINPKNTIVPTIPCDKTHPTLLKNSTNAPKTITKPCDKTRDSIKKKLEFTTENDNSLNVTIVEEQKVCSYKQTKFTNNSTKFRDIKISEPKLLKPEEEEIWRINEEIFLNELDFQFCESVTEPSNSVSSEKVVISVENKSDDSNNINQNDKNKCDFSNSATELIKNVAESNICSENVVMCVTSKTDNFYSIDQNNKSDFDCSNSATEPNKSVAVTAESIISIENVSLNVVNKLNVNTNINNKDIISTVNTSKITDNLISNCDLKPVVSKSYIKFNNPVCNTGTSVEELKSSVESINMSSYECVDYNYIDYSQFNFSPVKTLSQQSGLDVDISEYNTKNRNLTVAEKYDLERDFAPQPGTSKMCVIGLNNSLDFDGYSSDSINYDDLTFNHSTFIMELDKSILEDTLIKKSDEPALQNSSNTELDKTDLEDNSTITESDKTYLQNSSLITESDKNYLQDTTLNPELDKTALEDSSLIEELDKTLQNVNDIHVERAISRSPFPPNKINVSLLTQNLSVLDKTIIVDDKLNSSKIFMPKFYPPTPSDIELSLSEYNIPEHRFQEPFYSDFSDVTGKVDVGHNVLKIPSKTCADLNEFDSSIGFCGLETWRKEKYKQLYSSQDNKSNLRITLAGHSNIIMMPTTSPPNRQEVIEWLKSKVNEKVIEPSPKKSEKSRIFIPMSPGDGNESFDDTLSLSPCTPEMSSSPRNAGSQSTQTTPTSSPSSPSLRTTNKKNRKGNLQRKALFTQTMIKSSQSESSKLDEKDFKELNLDSSEPSPNDSCAITGTTLDNTHGFQMSFQNLQHAKALSEHQHLTVLIIELYIRTRADLNPDPRYDSVRALFYSILNDVPEGSKLPREETGVILVDTLPGSPVKNQKHLLDGTGVNCVITYVKSEVELVDEFVKLIHRWDPDIFAGYEIEMLSWGYLIDRCNVIEINLVSLISRLNPAIVKQKSTEFSEDHEIKLPGRIVLDIWRLLKHEIALTSYTFENVMYHILHRRVPKHSFKNLTFWWEHRTNYYRHITAQYYILRVEGVLQLLDQLDLIGRTSELARLFGIQFYEVLSRGSQFRVESMMLRLAKPLNYIPVSPSVQQRAKMRAPEWLPLILEPESRFYVDPVIVLDFQSLYPSMIIAYNYCFSTCIGRVENMGGDLPFEFGATQLKLPRKTLEKLKNKVNFSPCGVGFVKPEVRTGILPRMLREILETRLMVKNSMKENKGNKVLQRVLHSRQLGLKLIANVTYGYTAANFSGRMPCIEVGDSVVSKGRETLERAIKMIEQTPRWAAKVVYGDTDSLFVQVPGRSKDDAFKIGAEIAEAVTKDNPSPVKLKLEKIFQPCILQTKKRYVGYMYESPDQKEPEYLAKGIETVRRDGCPAVAKMLEKCLRILFEERDVSLVKRYVCRQFSKLLSGRASIQDLIFAREYRGSSGYRPGACVPAMELAKRWVCVDVRREPRRGERVPYVVVCGAPGLPLIRLVRSPHDLLHQLQLRPHALYYITRVIAPPLNRCLTLIGADVLAWFNEMPRKQLQSLPTEIQSESGKKSTISAYFATMSCAVCGGQQTRQGLCELCQAQPQRALVTLHDKVSSWERTHHEVAQICRSCCGRMDFTECSSLDCPVLYRLNQTERDLKQAPFVRNLILKCLE